MSISTMRTFGTFALAAIILGSSPKPVSAHEKTEAKKTLLPEPVVNHTAADAKPGQRIEHGELMLGVDEAKRKLHAQHHGYKVLETRQTILP